MEELILIIPIIPVVTLSIYIGELRAIPSNFGIIGFKRRCSNE
jgi:hypothetical protein